MNSPTVYTLNDIARVLTIPRCPRMPYMIVTVSMKTFRAREPDQCASTKPMEITSHATVEHRVQCWDIPG